MIASLVPSRAGRSRRSRNGSAHQGLIGPAVPHRSLPHQTTPAAAYAARPKANPTADRTRDTHDRVRTDRIDSTGCVTLRVNGRLHHIGIGRTHARTHTLLLIQDLHVRIIHATTGELLRELTIDPTRNYQPTRAPQRTTHPRNDNSRTHSRGSGSSDVLRHHKQFVGHECTSDALGDRVQSRPPNEWPTMAGFLSNRSTMPCWPAAPHDPHGLTPFRTTNRTRARRPVADHACSLASMLAPTGGGSYHRGATESTCGYRWVS